MALSKSGRLWAIPFFLATGMPVWAETAPVTGLQPYQEMALQAVIGQKGREVAKSPLLLTNSTSSSMSVRLQDLNAKERLLSADTTLVCVVPLHRYQAESKIDKGLGRQAEPASTGAIKTFPPGPVCRDSDRRP